jgi:hypothetical protein
MASKWLASFRQAGSGGFDVSTPAPSQKRQKDFFGNSGILDWPKEKNDSPDPLLAGWIEGVSQLRIIARPACIRAAGWQQVVADAGRFLQDFGGQAAVLGWTTGDIFGAHPTHPVQRIDCAGLILLHGDELVALTVEAGHIRTRTGAPMTFPRRRRPGAVPLCELG